MRFTQFLFPNGRRQENFIDMPSEIEKKADELELAGWAFEIECHPDTQIIYMDCCGPDEALASRFCPNGPDVPIKVEELVNAAHGTWIAKGMPKALGFCPRCNIHGEQLPCEECEGIERLRAQGEIP